MNALTQTDSYKLSHKGFMVDNTTTIYSNMTARSSTHLPIPPEEFNGKVVVYGLQHTIMDFLIEDMNDSFFNATEEKAVGYLGELFDAYLGKGSVPTDHFRQLHQLGYLPVEVKALPEGTLAPIKVPMYTIRNTHPDFAWLTNYLETVMSCETWKAPTVATIIYHYRQLVNKWAIKTTGSTEGTDFQLHDFSFRGMSNRHDSAKSGSAFLLSSNGTDNIPAIPFVSKYYGADWSKEFIATSVPASEHSLASTGIAVNGELETIRKWVTEDYPSGVVSVISDTMDFWKVITEYIPQLKEEILAREPNELGLAKVVVRPDSGDPVKIVCGDPDAPAGSAEHKGAIQCLYETFGGTETEQGYKVLHERIGLIYGDSMNYERIRQICERLASKGFASTNVVFGVGSFTMQYNTRDTLGMAVKATYAEVDGKGYDLFKDPATDDGTKKSAKGLLRVDYNNAGELTLFDQQNKEQEQQGLLETVFKDGKLLKSYSYSEIKERLWK